MFDPFGSNKFVSQFLYLRSASAHGQYLEAIVPVKVHVQTRYDHVTMFMLQIREHVLDVMPVMFINKRNCTGDLGIGHLLTMLDKLCTDHVCNR